MTHFIKCSRYLKGNMGFATRLERVVAPIKYEKQKNEDEFIRKKIFSAQV